MSKQCVATWVILLKPVTSLAYLEFLMSRTCFWICNSSLCHLFNFLYIHPSVFNTPFFQYNLEQLVPRGFFSFYPMSNNVSANNIFQNWKTKLWLYFILVGHCLVSYLSHVLIIIRSELYHRCSEHISFTHTLGLFKISVGGSIFHINLGKWHPSKIGDCIIS